MTSPNGNFVYVTNFAGNNVAIFSTSNNQLIDQVSVGSGPEFPGITPNGGLLYVPNVSDGTVSVVVTSTAEVLETIMVGNTPVAVAVTADGNYAYVTIGFGSDAGATTIATRASRMPDGYFDIRQPAVDSRRPSPAQRPTPGVRRGTLDDLTDCRHRRGGPIWGRPFLCHSERLPRT